MSEVRATDAVLCGWRLKSDIALPELPPGSAASHGGEIVFRLGRAAPLMDAVDATPLIEIGRSACRITIPRTGQFLIEGGASVTIEPDPDALREDVRTFLLGPVLGLLALQRGLLPLHAACVEIDGKATVLAGTSGSGKSVLAAALGRRGCRVLADEVTVIDFGSDVGPEVLPLCPSVVLWRDALDACRINTSGLAPNRSNQERYRLELSSPAAFDASPVPLGQISVLVPGSNDAAIHPLADGPTALAMQVHFARFVPLLAPPLSLVARCANRVDQLDIPWDLERIGEIVDMVLSSSRS